MHMVNFKIVKIKCLVNSMVNSFLFDTGTRERVIHLKLSFLPSKAIAIIVLVTEICTIMYLYYLVLC